MPIEVVGGLIKATESGTKGGLLRVPKYLDGQLSLGGWAGGTFPYDEDAADITISSDTSWTDSAGFKRVGLLTINSGIVLTIAISPFYIFAREIVFGSTGSIINGNGPSGASSGTFSAAYARGGTATGGSARAQGGCGGILLVVCAGRISGAAGVFRVNGGDGYRNTTAPGVGNGNSRGGQGCFSKSFNVSAASPEDWSGATGAAGTPPILSHLFTGTGGTGGATGGASGGSGASSGGGSGGSGIGGGGGATSGGATAGAQGLILPGPQYLLFLASIGCLGGGGGGAAVPIDLDGTPNGAGGGGGGGLLVYTAEDQVTPTLQANGGAATTNGANGAAGVAIQVTLAR